MSLNITEIQQKIDRLTESLQNRLDVEYDLFFNPNPLDITLDRYNERGDLVTITLPNYAKLQQRSAPVGMIITYPGETPPPAFLPCDAQEVSTADYPDLYTIALAGQTEPQPPFAPGSDEDHFKLPLRPSPLTGLSYYIKVLP